jgi:glycosyltransferase involved in cell wall biosynthesis
MKSKLRIGYVPYGESFTPPGDYRRFVGYANYRGIQFEVARIEEKYDLVILSSRADISVWCDYPHGKIVYDFINSYLDIPYNDIKGCLRGAAKYVSRQHARLELSYWESIRNMCRRADAVVCTTKLQKSRISPHCDNTHIVLDMHDAVVSEVKTNYKSGSIFKLIWEGLPENISQFDQICDVLYRLDKKHQLELNLVTDLVGYRFLGKFWKVSSFKIASKIFKKENIKIKVHAWNKKSCAELISKCDVAVIPINVTDPIEVGKPANKLLLLWRMGMPVVTSATPAYTSAMNKADLSLACNNDDQWFACLDKLIRNEDFRRSAGQKGKKFVEDNYSKIQLVEKWDKIFQSIGFDFSE